MTADDNVQGPLRWTVGTAGRSCDGETVCGDLVQTWIDGRGHLLVAVLDGLGHGPHARRASDEGVAAIGRMIDADLGTILRCCDSALRDTRGAAVALARFDFQALVAQFVGVGNVSAILSGARKRRLASIPGIVGTGLPALQVEHVPMLSGGFAALFTDGLDPLFDHNEPDVLQSDRAVQDIAQRLVQSQGRVNDDVGICMVRWGVSRATGRLS